MKSKALLAIAVAGVFASVGSMANEPFEYGMDQNSIISGGPSSVSEAPASMSTLTSLDTKTGGYKGWGPMANFLGPSSVNESVPGASIDLEREHRQHVAEVQSYREHVWVANAPLRAQYENIGATRSEAGGFGGFFSSTR